MADRTGVFRDFEQGRIPLLYVDMLDGTYALRQVVVNPDGSLVGSGGSGGPTADVNVNKWGGVATTLGQKTMVASVPIAIASDQSALPVSGTFWQVTQPVSVASLPLPTGAATEATLLNTLTTAAFQARINTLGQKVMASSTPVVISSDQSALPVTGTFWQVTQPISAAALPLPAGASQEHTTAGSPHSVRLSDGAAFYDATKTGQLPAALVGGRLDANIGAWLGSTAPTVGQKVMASSLPVVLASDQTSIPVAATLAAETVKVIGAVNQGTNPWVVDTELPAASAIGDGESATPSVPRVAVIPFAIGSAGTLDRLRSTTVGSDAIANVNFGHLLVASLGLGFDGSNWGRVRIDSGNKGLIVNGDIDHDVVNTLKNIQVAGHASPIQTAPAAVSATGDRARLWVDPRGAAIIRHRELQTYRSVFRLAARPYALSNAFAAAGRKQFATLYHINTSTKILRIVRVWAGVRTLSAAGIVSMELVALTAAVTPATPNPAITAQPHRSGGGAAEAVSMALPTTGGTEAANSIFGYREVQSSGASAIGTATNIPARGGFVTSGASTAPTDGFSDLPPLYEDGNDREQESLIVPNGVAGGFAVVFDSNAIITVTGFVVMEFTEETP